jgi:transposase InsO family protein
MRFQFIEAEKANHSVALLCRVLQVTRAGFYAQRKRPASPRARRERELKAMVREVFQDSRGRYGSPRVHAELKAQDQPVSRKRVARLMRAQGLMARPRRRFVVTTKADAASQPAPNLVARNFRVAEPDRVWAGDITYFPTREGWLYLAVMLDLHSRRVVGWATSENIDHELVCSAFQSAVLQRSPKPGLIAHSDRGSQYTSYAYQTRLAAVGATCSMSAKGECWDNAVVESFNGSLKRELALEPTVSRSEAKAALFEYIEAFYNSKRRHSTLDYLSPAEFESRA